MACGQEYVLDILFVLIYETGVGLLLYRMLQPLGNDNTQVVIGHDHLIRIRQQRHTDTPEEIRRFAEQPVIQKILRGQHQNIRFVVGLQLTAVGDVP